MLSNWAGKRGYSLQFLTDAGVFAALGNKLTRVCANDDREAADALQAAGLVMRGTGPGTRAGETQSLPIEIPARDLFSTARVIFTIRNWEGGISGFAGRAQNGDEQPKYLFSQGFPRGETLYRIERAVSQARSARTKAGVKPPAGRLFHLILVEGLVDALRLESVGLHAAAILGSRLAGTQAELLVDLAREWDRSGAGLAVHLFLDSDEAGRKGTVASLCQLMELAAGSMIFCVDVICPPSGQSTQKHDPDELLRDIEDPVAADDRIGQWCHSAMAFLLAGAMGCDVGDLAEAWKAAPASLRIAAFRDVERCIRPQDWPPVLDRVQPFQRWWGDETPQELQEWELRLGEFLRSERRATTVESREEKRQPAQRGEEAKLLHALQLAQSSTQRRELPVDDPSWERLLRAADVVIPWLQEHLRAENPQPLEPMVAVKIPRPDGDYRLKALACPEDLALQQYMLDEILKDNPNCRRFMELIPAVRYEPGRGSQSLRTTGPEPLRPERDETVSFAYQVDMGVLEGRTPPRREGMFRPYYACWKDFISYIDRRVRACVLPQLFVARLDIRRFYDSLPRFAVDNVLVTSLRDALSTLERMTDGGAAECAGSFRPDIREAERRADAIGNWLAGQTFGYSYLDPESGEQRATEWPDRGIPQGPDLSAYLANIALFPVDRAISSAVHELNEKSRTEGGGVVALYARYVDDMVLVAPSPRELERLRILVQNQLAERGLELSKKTEPLPPMTRAELRQWLTDRRGGLGASGPFTGPPANWDLNAVGPLGGAGDFDRSDSLSVLHDPRLDNPAISSDEVLKAVSTAMTAEDLRYSDLAAAARLLWRVAIDQPGQQPTTPRGVAKRFAGLWEHAASLTTNASSQALSTGNSDARVVEKLLAWFEGLERHLLKRTDRNPEISAENQRRVADQRIRLAQLVNEGLCEELGKCDGSVNLARTRFRHMFDLKLLAIRSNSVRVRLPDQAAPGCGVLPGQSPAVARFLISLHEGTRNVGAIPQHDPSMGVVVLFHEAIARLGAAASSRPDPLLPIGDRVEALRRYVEASGDVFLWHVLELWLPQVQASGEVEIARCAARALVNIAGIEPAELLGARKGLCEAILGCAVLPVPPGVGTPGLLGKTEENTIVRADLQPVEHLCPPDLKWPPRDSVGTALATSRSSLGERRLLEPKPPAPVVDGVVGKVGAELTKWLPAAYRSLVRHARSETGALCCPATAYNILEGPPSGAGAGQWDLLAYPVSRDRVVGQAFIRDGLGLVPEPVHEFHEEAWRIGTALADHLGYIEKSSSLRTLRLSVPPSASRAGDSWPVDALLRFACHRLRGLSLPPKALPVHETSGLPCTVERVLRRLETFPTASTPDDRLTQLAYLLATLTEGLALHIRGESDLDPARPGCAAALLTDLVRPQLHVNEELASQLPAPQLPEELRPKRRPVLAWLLLADRIARLSELDPLRETDDALAAIATGLRIVALESQLRAQSLERWAMLDARDRDRLTACSPLLGGWQLDSACALRRRPRSARTNGTGEDAPLDDAHGLFGALRVATADNSAFAWESLNEFTPLGWTVVLGVLAGLLPMAPNGTTLPRRTPAASDVAESLAALARGLATPAEKQEDLPWRDMRPLIGAISTGFTYESIRVIERLDDSEGIAVTTHESPRFHISTGRDQDYEVASSDGVRNISQWQASVASLDKEGSRAGVERFRKAGDAREWYRWSESWAGDSLLSVGIVQPGVASLAGIGHVSAVASADTEPATAPARQRVPTSPTIEPGTAAMPDGACVPVTKVSPPGDIFREVLDYQYICWKSRSTKVDCHARVAILQWDVDDTYRHPVFDLCINARQLPGHVAIEQYRLAPEKWTRERSESADAQSCVEHPRQRILQAALKLDFCHLIVFERNVISRVSASSRRLFARPCVSQGLQQWTLPPFSPSFPTYQSFADGKSRVKACSAFGVDILLLPEYSVRPETVTWLRQNLLKLAPKTSVWAGTYRKPPFSRNGDSVHGDWHAVLDVVVPNHDDEMNVRPRAKKYPSVALPETFRPFIESKVDRATDYRASLA